MEKLLIATTVSLPDSKNRLNVATSFKNLFLPCPFSIAINYPMLWLAGIPNSRHMQYLFTGRERE